MTTGFDKYWKRTWAKVAGVILTAIARNAYRAGYAAAKREAARQEITCK